MVTGLVFSTSIRQEIMFNFFLASLAATKSDLFSYERGLTNTVDGLTKAKKLFDDSTKGETTKKSYINSEVEKL